MKSFDIKTKIYFGDNALDRLADLPYKKALIITDPFVVKSGMLQMITYRLNDGYTEFDVFSDVVPDPPIEKISLGVKAMLDYDPDVVIAIGGGSAIDSAKSIREFATRASQKEVALIAVPTTSGTGSEVTSFAVVSDPANDIKYPLVSDSMLPTEAFAAGDWNGQPAVSAPAGSGTKEDPYLLADAADLKWFADSVNSSTKKSTATLCAELENDIDLSGQAWTPIGYYDSYSDCVYYGGVFDGNGYSISGLDIDNAKQYQALFGYVKNGTIKNLTVRGLVRTSTSGSAYAAGIVGYGYPVVLENCTNEAEITATAKGYAAGVVAYASSGAVLKTVQIKEIFPAAAIMSAVL